MSASSVKTSSAASWSEDETSQGSECEWEADLERVEVGTSAFATPFAR